jgi:hypothetical protein
MLDAGANLAPQVRVDLLGNVQPLIRTPAHSQFLRCKRPWRLSQRIQYILLKRIHKGEISYPVVELLNVCSLGSHLRIVGQ